MLKILHTADLHLDTPFTGSRLGRDQILARRADLIGTFKGLMRLAAESLVDMMLIAGDLFEEEYVNPSTLNRLFSLIGEIDPIPVIISPGNHDPYHSGSPYANEELPPNLMLFREDTVKKIEINDLKVNIYGVAITSQYEER